MFFSMTPSATVQPFSPFHEAPVPLQQEGLDAIRLEVMLRFMAYRLRQRGLHEYIEVMVANCSGCILE